MLDQMYDKELGIFMYKYKNLLLPKSFNDMFEKFIIMTRHKNNGIPFLKISKPQETLRILNSSFVILIPWMIIENLIVPSGIQIIH